MCEAICNNKIVVDLVDSGIFLDGNRILCEPLMTTILKSGKDTQYSILHFKSHHIFILIWLFTTYISHQMHFLNISMEA